MLNRFALSSPLVALAALAFLPTRAEAVVQLALIEVASGLNRPVELASVPGDPDRLFIVEKQGVIKILDLTTNTVLATPFLDINALVVNPAGGSDERGLLGLAFHPDHLSNGFFFVNYINNSSDTVIARYGLTGDPNVANAASALILMSIDQPETNHNGGGLRFGPDGQLYIALGDGGGGGDMHGPIGNGQNLATRLGKLLRIDSDGPDNIPGNADDDGFPADASNNYAVPPDNPFVGAGDPIDEIWAYGLRNPFKISFDRLNGDLWIGDVGQNAWEEIDHVSAASTGGENYGWRCMEGNACFNSPSGPNCTCNGPNLTDPVFAYSLAGVPCAVMGGYVYRGLEIPQQYGRYFFSDHCTAEIRSFDPADPSGTNVVHLNLPDTDDNKVTSYGEDANGNIYVATSINTTTGEVSRIDPRFNTPGDINANGQTNLEDAEILVDVLLGIDPGDPALVNRSDVNDDGQNNGRDIQAWIDEI